MDILWNATIKTSKATGCPAERQKGKPLTRDSSNDYHPVVARAY